MTPERRSQIEAMLDEHEQRTSDVNWDMLDHAPTIIRELLTENDDLRSKHAEWALRATIYHEMLLEGVHDADSIEREVQRRMGRAFSAANAIASLSS